MLFAINFEFVCDTRICGRCTNKVTHFLFLKSDKVFARAGPDQKYPVTWIYQRAGLPVEVTQEYDAWRKIRDAQGGEGWVNKVLLTTKRTVLIKADAPVTLRDTPDDTGRAMAHVEPGVVAGLKKCTRNGVK